MTDKRKLRARAISEKTGMSHQAAINSIAEGATDPVQGFFKYLKALPEEDRDKVYDEYHKFRCEEEMVKTTKLLDLDKARIIIERLRPKELGRDKDQIPSDMSTSLPTGLQITTPEVDYDEVLKIRKELASEVEILRDLREANDRVTSPSFVDEVVSSNWKRELERAQASAEVLREKIISDDWKLDQTQLKAEVDNELGVNVEDFKVMSGLRRCVKVHLGSDSASNKIKERLGLTDDTLEVVVKMGQGSDRVDPSPADLFGARPLVSYPYPGPSIASVGWDTPLDENYYSSEAKEVRFKEAEVKMGYLQPRKSTPKAIDPAFSFEVSPLHLEKLKERQAALQKFEEFREERERENQILEQAPLSPVEEVLLNQILK